MITTLALSRYLNSVYNTKDKFPDDLLILILHCSCDPSIERFPYNLYKKHLAVLSTRITFFKVYYKFLPVMYAYVLRTIHADNFLYKKRVHSVGLWLSLEF